MSPCSRATDRYTTPAIFFHWVIFLLVALAYLAIEIRGPRGSDSRTFWSSVHFWAGTLVLALAVLRLLWRLWAGAPAEIEGNRLLDVSRARRASRALRLYLRAAAARHSDDQCRRTSGDARVDSTSVTRWWARTPIARPLLKDAHEWLGNAFYWVIGLHALAAIAHHVVLQGSDAAADDLMLRSQSLRAAALTLDAQRVK